MLRHKEVLMLFKSRSLTSLDVDYQLNHFIFIQNTQKMYEIWNFKVSLTF